MGVDKSANINDTGRNQDGVKGKIASVHPRTLYYLNLGP